MSAATCLQAPRLRSKASRTSTSSGVLMSRSIAKFCGDNKQHFARLAQDIQGMADSIVHVVARALDWHMKKAGLTETALGKKAGVSPRTVGNFLRPDKREISASGKVPSGKLTELEMIAAAPGIEFVDLVTDMSPGAREQRQRQALAIEILMGGVAGAAESAAREGGLGEFPPATNDRDHPGQAAP